MKIDLKKINNENYSNLIRPDDSALNEYDLDIDKEIVKDEYRWVNKDEYEDLINGNGYKTFDDLIPTIDRDVACLMDCNCRSECSCRKDCGCKNDCGCKRQTG